MPGWARVGSVLVRAAHLTSCAAILGLQLAGASGQGKGSWWALAGISGLLLLVYEWASHPDHWRQLSGWITPLKLALLGVARLVPALTTAIMLTVFFVAVLGAHLPRRWRHRLVV